MFSIEAGAGWREENAWRRIRSSGPDAIKTDKALLWLHFTSEASIKFRTSGAVLGI